MTQLHEAVISKSKKTVAKILADDPTEVHATDHEGDTPLHLAVLKNPKLIPLLLEYGANINAQNNKGDTPLHLALKETVHDTTAVLSLIKHGADISIENNEGILPVDLVDLLSTYQLMGDINATVGI